MKKRRYISLLLIMTACGIAAAADLDPAGVWKVSQDSAIDASSVGHFTADTVKGDSLHGHTPGAAPLPEGSNLKLIKRSYNNRQQLLLASGMMIFVIAMMTAAQQWNPE